MSPSAGRGSLAAAAAAALLAVGLGGCDRRPPRYRNLVLVVVDTLRSDHLASYGYERETAPALSRLAEEGIQLQGYAASSWTKSSVATLLSGLHPQRHQANSGSDLLPEAAPFLAEILSRAGYATVGYSANAYVSIPFGFARGYDRFPATSSGFPGGGVELEPLKPRAAKVTDIGLELADGLEPPFLLHLHYLDPHDPYVPEVPWGGGEGGGAYLQPAELVGRLERLRAGGPEIRRLIDQYDAAILETDSAIGRLLEGLRREGLLEETLVVVTSDHGEEFLEHGQLTHGKTLYEESIAVPFLLWAEPPLPAYASPAVFHQVDFLPTVLAAVGIEAPQGLDGRDLWRETIEGALPTEREALFLLAYTPGMAALAVSAPPFKLIHQQWPPTNQLFRLDVDPAERAPLGAEPAAARLLRDLLRRHNRLAATALPGAATEIAGAARDQLEALGYLGGGDGGGPPEPGAVPAPLRFYGARADALFGDEPASELRPRLDLSRPSFQLRAGWLAPTPDGAWSRPRSSVALPAVSGAARLFLRGRVPEGGGEVRCTVARDGVELGRLVLAPGPFRRTLELPPGEGGAVSYYDFAVEPPLTRPGGAAPLGLFWRTIGIEPAAAATPSAPAATTAATSRR